MSEDDFLINIHKEIFSKVYFEYENQGSKNPASLISLFNEETQSYLRELTISQYSLSTSWQELNPSITQEIINKKYAIDLLVKYKQMHIDLKIAENIEAQENADNEKILLDLMREKQELEKQKKLVQQELKQQ